MSLIELGSPKSKLEFLRRHLGSRNKVAEALGVDRSQLRRFQGGGTKLNALIDEKIKRIWAKHGSVPLKFPTPVSELLDLVRATDSPKKGWDKRAETANLKANPAIAMIAEVTLETAGPTRENTVMRALSNVVAAQVNVRVGERVLTGPVQVEQRVLVIRKSLSQAKASAVLLGEALNQTKTAGSSDETFSDEALVGMLIYALLLAANIVAQHRPNLSLAQNCLPVFTNDEVRTELRGVEPHLWHLALDLFPAGHPNRLIVAVSIISIGSVRQDNALSLRAWRIAADEEPAAADLRNQLTLLSRPLSESDLTEWLRSSFGFVVPAYASAEAPLSLYDA
jgi:hypothetical protein